MPIVPPRVSWLGLVCLGEAVASSGSNNVFAIGNEELFTGLTKLNRLHAITGRDP